MKYSQCPGPHEKVTLAFSHPYLVAAPEKEREEGDGKMASMMFKLTKAVPKNGQLNMMYASSEKEVDGFLELVAERMEVLVKENIAFQERVERLGEKVVLQEGREHAVQDALVTAQELRQDVKKQASREAWLLEREARMRIEGMIGESEKLLKEHSAVVPKMAG